jgi:hypothetical protein
MGFGGNLFKKAWNKASDTAKSAAAAVATGAEIVSKHATNAAQKAKKMAFNAAKWIKKTAQKIGEKATRAGKWAVTELSKEYQSIKKKVAEAYQKAKEVTTNAVVGAIHVTCKAVITMKNTALDTYDSGKDYALPKTIGKPVEQVLSNTDADNKLIEKALKSNDPQIQALGKQLQELNYAEEMAFLSKDVYAVDGKIGPEDNYGWKKLSADPESLKKIGLCPEDFNPQNIEFRAALYQKDGRTVFVIKGTESIEDWLHNLKQGIGIKDEYYEHAIEVGQKLKDLYGDDLEISGHSLGGGLATAVGLVTKSKTTVFNPAGVHPKTIEGYALDNSDIKTYQVEGEILTTVQENRETLIPAVTTMTLGGVLGPVGLVSGERAGLRMIEKGDLPKATGDIEKLQVSPKGEHSQWKLAEDLGYNPLEGIERHGMPSVINSIQDKQNEIRSKLKTLENNY